MLLGSYLLQLIPSPHLVLSQSCITDSLFFCVINGSAAQSCLTLCNPMDCSPPGCSVHRMFQARLLEWGAISYSRALPYPGIKPTSLASPALVTTELPTEKSHRLFQFSSVQSLSHVRLFVTPWTAAHQVSLSITNSRSLLKLIFIESVMLANHLILCRPPLLLPPSIFLSIRVFSNESVFLHQVAKVLEF